MSTRFSPRSRGVFSPILAGYLLRFHFARCVPRLFLWIAALCCFGAETGTAQQLQFSYRLKRVDLQSQDPWPDHWLTWLDYNAEAVIAYNANYIGAPTDPNFRFQIYYASNSDEYQMLTGEAGSVGVTINSVEGDGLRRSKVFFYNQDLEKADGGWRWKASGDSFCTVLHEMCHAIHFSGSKQDSFGKLPMPFQEGLCDYIAEQYWYVSIPKKRDRTKRLDTILKLIDDGKLPSLNIFFQTKDYADWDLLFDGNRVLGYIYGMFLAEFFLDDPKRAAIFTTLMKPLRGIGPTQERKGILFINATDQLYPRGMGGLQGEFIRFLGQKKAAEENAPLTIEKHKRLFTANQQHLNNLLQNLRIKKKPALPNERWIISNQWLTTLRYEAEYHRVRGRFSLDIDEIQDIHNRCFSMIQSVDDIFKEYKKAVDLDRDWLIKEEDIYANVAWKMVPPAANLLGMTGSGFHQFQLPPLDPRTSLPLNTNFFRIHTSHIRSLSTAILKLAPP